ncbi:MarR family winged helix-turn-helix transcriptional regulator [Solicola gregarius]|uniref:MarR family transcriptional regulator n=1 Tax=Solicola gregarius TaxID=2908642 RepID=A0AA46TI95_9ACTN|nr:MarR family transcriptional regulator [Solicola gregarius]UYM05844.1 MarR family transcriptional regulator [Solicola gregarius]
MDRTANLLGAAALALTDVTLGDAARVGQLSTSSAAALVTLLSNPGLSVSELGRRVGLSQPAAARMVEALEANDLVERVPSTVNRRWMTVRPTRQGNRLANQLLSTRNAPLVDVIGALDAHDQGALAELLEKILTHLSGQVGRAQYICRFCDRQGCTKSAPCPVGHAEQCQAT